MTCCLRNRFEWIAALVVCASFANGRATLAQDATAAAEPIAATIKFNRDVQPILSNTCFKCHGFDEKERKAELRLDTKDGLTRVHKGVTPVVAGDLAKSELYRRINDVLRRWGRADILREAGKDLFRRAVPPAGRAAGEMCTGWG